MNRPVIFVAYALYIITITVIGVYGNWKIIFMKLRKIRHLCAIEVVIMNFAFSLILHTITLWIIVSEEVWPSVTEYLCNFNPIARSFTMIFVGLLIILLICTAKFSTNIKILHGLILILIIWVISIVYAFPYFELRASPLYSQDDKFQRFMCVYYNPNVNVDAIEAHHKITTIFNFITCPVLISICVIMTTFWRNSAMTCDKDIWTYSIVIGLYYLIADSPLMINALSSYIYRAELSRGVEEFFSCLVSFTVVLNPILYGIFVDRNFLEECLKILHFPCRKRSRRIRYINPNDDVRIFNEQ